MKRLLITLISFAAVITASAKVFPRKATETKSEQLDKAKVLPLALDDAFEFRKVKTLLNDREMEKATLDPMIAFERQRINFGAVTEYDREQRRGHYFTFFWRVKRPANLTMRLEYRQQRLGAYVQAKEVNYPLAKGSMVTDFQIIGDDYHHEGKITGWRALLIENGKIVALKQSFLWN